MASHVFSVHVYPMTVVQQRVLRRLYADEVNVFLMRVMASLVLLLRMALISYAEMGNAYRAVHSSAVLWVRFVLMECADLILVWTSSVMTSRAVTKGGV